MTKKDRNLILTTTLLVSIFVGAAVLTAVLIKNRHKVKRRRLKYLVAEDQAYWTDITETSRKGAEKLAEWWGKLGYNYSVSQLMSSAFQNEHFWSAVYISNLMMRWGAGDRFRYSASHSVFILEGKENKAAKNNNLFYTYRPDEVPLEVGDIVAISRSDSVNYDNLYVGAPTHTDVVYSIIKTADGFSAIVIGGNLSNTVKSTKVSLDKDKKIIDPEKYLAIMKNQDL